MLSRQDKRHVVLTYLIGFIVLFFILIAGYKIIYAPLRGELLQLHHELSEQTPNNINGTGVTLGEAAPWLETMSYSSQQLRQKLLMIIGQASVHLQSMHFDERQSSQSFYEEPVQINVTGSFAHTMKFLVALVNSHLVFSFEQVSLMQSDSLLRAVILLHLRMLQ